MNEFTLIEAAGDARPKIVGTAYSGGKMSLPGWKNPVVRHAGVPPPPPGNRAGVQELPQVPPRQPAGEQGVEAR